MVGKRKPISDEKGFVSGSDSDSELSESDKQLQLAFARNEIDTDALNIFVPFVRREIVNDIDGLKENLVKFKLDLPWNERLDLINDLAPVAPELAAHLNEEQDVEEDDFKREVIFYRQAQAAVLEGIPRLKSFGIATKRPDDYFAQMLKTDDHMQRVRQILVNKNAAMERREKVRKMRELRKYGKKVQTEVLQQRAKEKREIMDSVKKFRKGQKNKLDFLEFDDDETGKGNQNVIKEKKGQRVKPNKMSKGQKNSGKAEKYGYGGKRKRSKYNDAESSAGFGDSSSRSKKSKMGGRKFGSNKKKQNLKMNRRKGRK